MPHSTDLDYLLAEINAQLAALPDQSTEAVRAVERAFSARLKKAPARAVVELGRRLLAGPTFAHRLVAYELIHYHRAALASLTAADLTRLGKGLDSWQAVDTFAPYLAGPAWRAGQVPDTLLAEWADSNDRWWRRAAVVATVALNNAARGGTGDAPRTLAICALVVTDGDDMVIKALSWALRELAKRDPAAVQAFLAQHAAVLAPRVKREVGHQLRTGLKNPKP